MLFFFVCLAFIPSLTYRYSSIQLLAGDSSVSFCSFFSLYHFVLIFFIPLKETYWQLDDTHCISFAGMPFCTFPKPYVFSK